MRMCQAIALATVVAAAAGPAVAGQADEGSRAAFDDIHRTVAEHFLDADLGGLDWEAVGAAYAQRAEASATLEEFGTVVNEMLGLLETSHTRFLTSREPAYFQLLAIFHASLDETIRAAHPENPELRYPGIGIFTIRRDGAVFVSGVIDGCPAAEAGLRIGDRIVAVDGAPFHPIGSFEGRVGAVSTIEVQRTSDPSSRRIVEVTPAMIDPRELFVQAMERSVRVIEGPAGRVGYVHLWSYAGPRYQEVLESELAFGRLRGADALILDLRGGWGGANPRDLNLFNDRVPTMTHITREGQVREIDFQWRKPAALLVDGGSRSGKEVFAYGFKKHGIGPVVGSRTAGAVVGGRPFLIRPGMLLYLAVLDVLIDGERLEGRGVEPDVVVPFDVPYADGADPALEAALDVVSRAGRRPQRRPRRDRHEPRRNLSMSPRGSLHRRPRPALL
jgi:carboxyl-terminal processing protease